MLRPSYSELMEKLNLDKKDDNQITSRYTIVLAAAKRARQIIDGANPLTYAPNDRAVSIAVRELSEGKLLIKTDTEQMENNPERGLSALYYNGMSAISKDDLREDFKDKYEPAVDEDEDIDDDDYKEDSYRDEEEPDDEMEEEHLDEYADDDFDDEE